jgi:protein phosphatase 1G
LTYKINQIIFSESSTDTEVIISNIGKEVAQYVKNHFTTEFTNSKSYQNGDYKNALIETFLKIDELLVKPEAKVELKKYAKQSKEEETRQTQGQKDNQMDAIRQMMDPRASEECDIALFTGCTASVCYINEDEKKIYFSNAGDSRGIICKKGVAYAMTEDHKPDLDGEKTRIYKAEGWVSEGRVKGNLNLSRSLGDLEYKQNKKLSPAEQMITAYPEITIDSLTPDCDFIVVACDGVWDCMTNQEICDFISERIKKNIKLSKIIEEIFDNIVATDIYNGNLF